MFAVACDDDFAVFAALENAFKIVEAQVAFWPLLAMAAQARSLKERFDIFGVGEVFLFRGGRKFAEIEFVEIEFVSGDGGRCSAEQTEEDEVRDFVHRFANGEES